MVCRRDQTKRAVRIAIEAQLGVPEAVHEMLMRTENGVVRIFKDCPPAWAEYADGIYILDMKPEETAVLAEE